MSRLPMKDVEGLKELQEKVEYLEKRYTELYKVLTAKHSFLEFSFAEDLEEKRKKESESRTRMAAMASMMAPIPTRRTKRSIF